jgi:hypothetical protein
MFIGQTSGGRRVQLLMWALWSLHQPTNIIIVAAICEGVIRVAFVGPAISSDSTFIND